ncbi:MAG: hypothetical protein PCFJNLEI_01532 [Verrucomicrobiae bacterium]|nr:hypothetical protein [Verrucomicrobiae bacterium]
MRIFIGGIFWAAVALGQVDEAKTTAALPSAASVSNCLVYLDNALAELETLAASAAPQSPAAICLTDKLNKARSLRELAASLVESVEQHEADEDLESADDDRSLVLAACARVDKIKLDARDCAKAGHAKKKRRNEPPVLTAVPGQPTVATNPVTPASILRDATTCLKQAEFAELLVGALGFGAGRGGELPIPNLTNRQIEPLKGWQAEDCLTVDDLCVVVARALKLVVTDDQDPYSYVLAVRQAGLPVDSVLPRRRRESVPALVLESEARLFLARGYAARLPSSRRVQPD